MSVTILHILYLIAISAEAMTTALSAGRRSMDWFGVCLPGTITALGGGSIRDLLLGNHPLNPSRASVIPAAHLRRGPGDHCPGPLDAPSLPYLPAALTMRPLTLRLHQGLGVI